MKCPIVMCGSAKLKVLVTREPEDSYNHLPQRLGAHNIIRRRRQCHRGHLFWTIELPETEYETLMTTHDHFTSPNIRGGGRGQ